MARGAKTGGRKKGASNRATAAKAKAVAESGLTPLDYMIDVMRTPLPPELAEALEAGTIDEDLIAKLISWHGMRFEAAKAAAPYIHPRLQSTTVKIPDGFDIRVIERVIVRE